MKFILFVLVLGIFVSCTDKASLDEIESLKAENSRLELQVKNLHKELDSLNTYRDSVKKHLDKLDMAL